MCGRFRLALPNDALASLFALDAPPEVEARYNIAPGQTVLAVRAASGSRMECWRPLWGLVPSWVKEVTQAQLINARAETAAEKPAFRKPFRTRRCLLPADGFYEWAPRPSAGPRIPWLITMTGETPFAFAGLWDRYIKPDGEALETVTILTTSPNELVARIHNRMPVILDPGDFALWLDPDLHDPARGQPLLRPCPAERMRALRIGTFVNNPRNEGPECSAPAPDQDLLSP
jgi:putative SOS response-associated peptidase YedK